MAESITIEGKIVGQRRPLFPAREIPLAGGVEPLTLRELIARVVREEVGAYRDRQEAKRFVQALTAAQIEEGVAAGKVDMGGREAQAEAVDPEEAVATALLAFQDGLYYVFVDDEQQESLDRQVSLKAGSRVTFLRLVALAGG